MSELIGLFFGFVLTLFCLLAFFIVLKVLFSGQIEKTRRIADQTPGRSFLVGVVNFTFFFAVALAFIALGNAIGLQLFQVVAVFILAIPALGIIFGLGGMVELTGERIAPDQHGVRRTAWGALAMSLACALPFVGWFGLLPYASLVGMGAFIIGLFQRKPKSSHLVGVQEDGPDL